MPKVKDVEKEVVTEEVGVVVEDSLPEELFSEKKNEEKKEELPSGRL
ncbi:MAG: hypothetical protein AABY07_01355 [Nanoarchaeota archaeon]